MNAAFKVGLIALLAIGTSLFAIIFIWQINPYSSYKLYGYFSNVGGIAAGSEVTLMGVRIGEVVDIVPDPIKRRVKVGMSVGKEHQIPVGSTFTIVTTGLVGNKSLEILPPKENVEVFLEPDSEVTGIPPSSIDAIFTEAQEMLKSARSLIDDQELRADIKQTIKMVSNASTEMNELFKDIRVATKGFGRITKQTESLLAQVNAATAATIPEIQNIVGSVRQIAYNTESVSRRVNTLVNDPVVFDDTKSTLQNVKNITGKWNDLSDDLKGLSGKVDKVLDNAEGITNDIRDITSDQEIKASVKSVARNASRLTNTILALGNTDENRDKMDIDIRTEALGVANLSQDFKVTPGAQVNFNVFGKLGLDIPISYFRVGLDEIGDSNLVNLQVGTAVGDDSGIIRLGLVRGRIGAGTDINFSFLDRPLTISGELYDINAPHMRLGILQNIYEDYGMSFYWDNQFLTGINEFSLGLRWQPGSRPEPKKTPTAFDEN